MSMSMCQVVMSQINLNLEDPDLEDPDKRGTVKYYLAPLPQFEIWKTLVMLFQVTGLHGCQ